MEEREEQLGTVITADADLRNDRIKSFYRINGRVLNVNNNSKMTLINVKGKPQSLSETQDMIRKSLKEIPVCSNDSFHFL